MPAKKPRLDSRITDAPLPPQEDSILLRGISGQDLRQDVS